MKLSAFEAVERVPKTTLAEITQGPLPGVTLETEYCAYIADATTVLAKMFVEGLDMHPLSPGELLRVRQTRSALLGIFKRHKSELLRSEDAHFAPGWNRFFLTWAVVCQFRALEAYNAPIDVSNFDNRVLCSEGLALHPKPLEVVSDASLSTLKSYLELAQSRVPLTSRWGAFRHVIGLVAVLEQRIAQFVAGVGPSAEDCDLRRWRLPNRAAINRRFILHTAFAMHWLYFYIDVGAKLRRDSYLVANHPVVRMSFAEWETEHDETAAAATVVRYFREKAEEMESSMHCKLLREQLRPLEVSPPATDIVTYDSDILGASKCGITTVLHFENTPEAAQYRQLRKYYIAHTEPARWINDLVFRSAHQESMRLCGGRSNEFPQQNAAIFFMMNSLFMAMYGLEWCRFFHVRPRVLGSKFDAVMQKLMGEGYPFVVNALGFFLCIQPRTMRRTDGSNSVLVVECSTASEALTCWARWTLLFCGGELQGGVHCKPILEGLLGHTPPLPLPLTQSFSEQITQIS